MKVKGSLISQSPAAGSGTFTPINDSWSYDLDSRVTSMRTPDGTASNIGYDADSQLTGVDYTYQSDESYTYDADGNPCDPPSRASALEGRHRLSLPQPFENSHVSDEMLPWRPFEEPRNPKPTNRNATAKQNPQ